MVRWCVDALVRCCTGALVHCCAVALTGAQVHWTVALPQPANKSNCCAGAAFGVALFQLDSMSGFYPSWVTVGAGYGITVTEEQFYAYGGWPLPEIVKDLHKKCLGTDATDAFVDEFLAKKRVVREQQEKERGPPAAIDPVVAVARAHVAAGIPIYAVSMPTAPPAQPQCYAAQLWCYAVSMPQRSDAHLHSRHASTSGICHVT